MYNNILRIVLHCCCLFAGYLMVMIVILEKHVGMVYLNTWFIVMIIALMLPKRGV